MLTDSPTGWTLGSGGGSACLGVGSFSDMAFRSWPAISQIQVPLEKVRLIPLAAIQSAPSTRGYRVFSMTTTLSKSTTPLGPRTESEVSPNAGSFCPLTEHQEELDDHTEKAVRLRSSSSLIILFLAPVSIRALCLPILKTSTSIKGLSTEEDEMGA